VYSGVIFLLLVARFATLIEIVYQILIFIVYAKVIVVILVFGMRSDLVLIRLS